MIRKLLSLVLIVILSSAAFADDVPATRPAIHINHPGLSKLGWQLACIGSTFRDRPVTDMVDLLHSLNFHHIELSTGQLDPSDTAAADALMAKLKTIHTDLVSFGVIDPGKTEADARKIFEFGKRLKIKTIAADPSDDSIGMLDKLANEYKINVAIVNFAKPGNHWDPEALSKLLTGRSARMGVCADVAAWRASSLTPGEAAKTLGDRILEVRLTNFSDLDSTDVLHELKNAKFKGICAVGCANEPTNNLIDRFTRNINAFSDIVGDLSGVK